MAMFYRCYENMYTMHLLKNQHTIGPYFYKIDSDLSFTWLRYNIFLRKFWHPAEG